ncbi:unnamed protein product [Cylicocyclus nassatus]|uniref:Uncharacterized protein n=1 Tax=Cylicocyclus nassatus TaxID=53992 RepID=A0AA36DRQ6_CYLNA|nr:unnamed protein product [Cylicocyclus nassatus]
MALPSEDGNEKPRQHSRKSSTKGIPTLIPPLMAFFFCEYEHVAWICTLNKWPSALCDPVFLPDGLPVSTIARNISAHYQPFLKAEKPTVVGCYRKRYSDNVTVFSCVFGNGGGYLEFRNYDSILSILNNVNTVFTSILSYE